MADVTPGTPSAAPTSAPATAALPPAAPLPTPAPANGDPDPFLDDEPLDATTLGLRFTGSANTGHLVEVTRRGGLTEVFGTDDRPQANALLTHCLKVLHPNEAGDNGAANDERHFLLSIVSDIAPRDAVERMLAVQMAATHVAVIRSGRLMATSGTVAHFEAYSIAYNKLARTYTAQMEALRKHRDGGKQKVTVEHVHVYPGGQAIVGEVHHGAQGTRGEGGTDGK